MKLTLDVCVVQRLRIHRAMPPVFVNLHGVVPNKARAHLLCSYDFSKNSVEHFDVLPDELVY